MAIPLLAPVVATVVGAVAKTLALDTLKWLAMRALLIGLVGTLLPVILYNLLTDVLLEFMQYASSVAPDGQDMSSVVVSMTGIAGWVALQLKLPESFSVVMSACALRWSLNFIPFVRI